MSKPSSPQGSEDKRWANALRFLEQIDEHDATGPTPPTQLFGEEIDEEVELPSLGELLGKLDEALGEDGIDDLFGAVTTAAPAPPAPAPPAPAPPVSAPPAPAPPHAVHVLDPAGFFAEIPKAPLIAPPDPAAPPVPALAPQLGTNTVAPTVTPVALGDTLLTPAPVPDPDAGIAATLEIGDDAIDSALDTLDELGSSDDAIGFDGDDSGGGDSGDDDSGDDEIAFDDDSLDEDDDLIAVEDRPGAAGSPEPPVVPAISPPPDTRESADEEVHGYYVQDRTGRVIGPLPEDLVATLLLGNKLEGDEKIRTRSTDPWQELESVSEFAAALKVRQPTKGQRAGVAKPEFSVQLDVWGVAPLFLHIARRQLTGWLKVTRGEQNKVVSFLMGRPTNARSNNPEEFFCALLLADGRISEDHVERALKLSKEMAIPVGNALVSLGAISAKLIPEVLKDQARTRVRNLFRWSSGLARFDIDSVAGRDDDLLQIDARELVREMAADLGPRDFTLILGDQDTRVKIGELGKDALDDLEQEIVGVLQLAGAGDGLVLGLLLEDLESRGTSARKSQQALCCLRAMGVLQVPKTASGTLREWRQRLWHANLYDVLQLTNEATVGELRSRLGELRRELREQTTDFDPDDPGLIELQQRLDEIYAQIGDPLERHIMARAHFMGVDCSDEAVRNVLTAEYLEPALRKGLAKRRFAEVLPLAERFLELAPRNHTAAAYLGTARFFTLQDPAKRREVLEALAVRAAEFPQSVELQLAVAETAHEAGHREQALRALENAELIAAGDRRVDLLKKQLGSTQERAQQAGTEGSDLVLILAAEGRFHTLEMLVDPTGLPRVSLPWSRQINFNHYVQQALANAQRARTVMVDFETFKGRGISLCDLIVADKVKRDSQLPRLLAIGARDETVPEEAVLRVGCDAYLPRPLDKAVLYETLKQLGAWHFRRTRRADVRLRVSWTHPDGSRCDGRTFSLSDGGISFASEQPIPVGKNVPLELHLKGDERPATVTCWFQVIRTQPLSTDEARFTAFVAGRYLNLPEGDLEKVREAIRLAQQEAFEKSFGKELSAELDGTVVKDFDSHLVGQWFTYLINPALFGSPPPAAEIDADQLRRHVGKLLPHEEVLFSVHDPDERPNRVQLWLRAWAAFRAVVVHLRGEAPNPQVATSSERRDFVEAVQSVLEMADHSLARWADFQQAHTDAASLQNQHSLLLALEEIMALRGIYNELRQEDDPEYFAALESARDYFRDPEFNDYLVRYEKRKQFVSRKQELDKQLQVSDLTAPIKAFRKVGFALLAVVAISFGVASYQLASRTRNTLVEADDTALLSAALVAGYYSKGKDTRVFFGAVSPGLWSVMERSRRQETAEEIQLALRERTVMAGVITCEERMVIQIENFKVSFVE